MSPAPRGCYSQSRRRNTTYSPAHTTAISPSANGYPAAQCSSGMTRKFIPYTVPTSVGANRMAAQAEIFLTSSPCS